MRSTTVESVRKCWPKARRFASPPRRAQNALAWGHSTAKRCVCATLGGPASGDARPPFDERLVTNLRQPFLQPFVESPR